MKDFRRKIKNITIGMLLVFLMNLSGAVCAQQRYGYTSGAYGDKVGGGSYLQRVSDWFATVGKTKKEKAYIKARRRTARRIIGAKKAVIRKKKEIARKQKQLKKR